MQRHGSFGGEAALQEGVGLRETLQGRYDLKLPGHDKLVGGTTLTVPTLLAHEKLAREVTAEPSLERHPVVVAASPSGSVWP